MKNTALLGVLALFAAPQSIQCGEATPNLKMFTKNDLNLFLYSPNANQDVAAQRKAILGYASKFEDKKAIIVVNDNTYMTPEFLNAFPKNQYQALYDEHEVKCQDTNQVFTALAKQTIVKKLNVAFDYFFDCPSCTLKHVIDALSSVLHVFKDKKVSDYVSKILNENFSNDQAFLKVSEFSTEQVNALNKIKKILLNIRYARAITTGERLKKHMFVCVNTDEVDALQETLISLGWRSAPSAKTGEIKTWTKIFFEQNYRKNFNKKNVPTMIPKPKPPFFSWRTMTALGVGAVSFSALGLVAYENGFFGKVGGYARSAVARMFPHLYRLT